MKKAEILTFFHSLASIFQNLTLVKVKRVESDKAPTVYRAICLFVVVV